MGKIYIIGLGAGSIEQVPFGIYQKLKEHSHRIYVRTKDHPVIHFLEEEGVVFHGLDHIYEQHDQFADVYEHIVDYLQTVSESEDIVYAVPGHPMLAEKTVKLLLQLEDVELEIVGGQSFLDDLFTALQIDPIDGFQFIDATSFRRADLSFSQHIVFCQVYDQFVASEVKLALLEDLPPDYEVVLVEAVGTKQEKLQRIPLEELDRMMDVHNLTSLYVPPVKKPLRHQFQTLREVIRTLRSPEGCPWDQKQTHHSLRKYLQEETYELIDAIQREDDEAIIEELGDVLLQVMLHSQIGEDEGYFSIEDVMEGITNKMIHRHPHVFDLNKSNKTWEELKIEEKGTVGSVFHSIIPFAPALQVAYDVQEKVAKLGFDWERVDEVWEKWEEELHEFDEAVKNQNDIEMEKEFGDMLFVLANIARFYEIYPEHALQQTNEKFMRRFQYIEQRVNELQKDFSHFTLAELDVFWEEAKQKENEDAFR